MLLRSSLLAVLLSTIPSAALAQATQTDLFDDSVVHEVRMNMNPANWQKLLDNIYDSTDYPVDSFQWTGPRSLTASLTNLAIHSRGHGSRDPRKPGLHVGFNNVVKGQTFLGLSDLDLKSNTEDGSLVHERMTFLLFRRLGVPASREAHTRVYMNGTYLGVYNLVEAVDTDFLKRIFNETTGFLFKYNPGDWLTNLMGSKTPGYHFEYLGQDLGNYAAADTSRPFIAETHSNAPDTVTLEGFIRIMNQASDADFIRLTTVGDPQLGGPYLDPKSWLLHIAVESYVADFDCILGDAFGLNNFYMYRFQNSPLLKFIAWDKDLAFDWNGRPILRNADQNVLMKRLMAIPEYKAAYLEALTKVAMMAGGPGGWYEQEAYREYNQIKTDAYADPNKLTLVAGFHVPVPNDTGCTVLSDTCMTFESFNNYVKAFPGIRTPFVLQSVSDEGYHLPSNYPSIFVGGVASAAVSGGTAQPASGGLASVYGLNFDKIDNTTIYVNGYEAPIFFAAPGQVNIQIPWEVSGPVTVGAVVNGLPSNVVTANVGAYAPGVFVVVHGGDNSPVTAANPATANETLVIYATGLGPVAGSMLTGKPASSTAPFQTTTKDPTVTVGGAPAEVQFSGLTGGFVGLYQINVKLPSSFVAGPQTQLLISIGGQTSPAVPLPTR